MIRRIAAAAIAAALLISCQGDRNPAGPTRPPSASSVDPTAPILVGAGDIADCTNPRDSLTANLLDTIPGTVFALGDNAYENGAPADYQNCYDPHWGRQKARTRPAPGNHDYNTPSASGYFGYFGAAAGDPAKGYYSYDIASWHVVVLNSNVDASASSPQVAWLKSDLAASSAQCTAAYWHHPFFTSGTTHGHAASMQAAVQALYDAGADVLISGHEHNYERFAPQRPDAAADPSYGLRQFVVGTGGGEGLYNDLGTPSANSEVRNDETFGVLRMSLHDTGYEWRFVPEPRQTFTDVGTAACH